MTKPRIAIKQTEVVQEPIPDGVDPNTPPRITIRFFVGDSSPKRGGVSYTEEALMEALKECSRGPVFVGCFSEYPTAEQEKAGQKPRRYVSATGVPAKDREDIALNTVELAVDKLLEKGYIKEQLAGSLKSRIAEEAVKPGKAAKAKEWCAPQAGDLSRTSDAIANKETPAKHLS